MLGQHIPEDGKLSRCRLQEPFIKIVELTVVDRQQRQRRVQFRLALFRCGVLLLSQQRLRPPAERADWADDLWHINQVCFQKPPHLGLSVIRSAWRIILCCGSVQSFRAVNRRMVR